jgi:hypothetical protein
MKNIEDLLGASRGIDLEVNTKKTKHVVVSCHQNAGGIHNLKTAGKCFENVGKFKYLGKTIKNHNCAYEKIMSGLNSGNACYNSVQILSCSLHLYKKLEMHIYKSRIVPGFLMTVKHSCHPEDGL